METLLTVFGCSGTTNLSQEEQRFGKVPGNFLLQVKGQLLLFFCGRKTKQEIHTKGQSVQCFWMDSKRRHDIDNDIYNR